jgi:hypothetical protein
MKIVERGFVMESNDFWVLLSVSTDKNNISERIKLCRIINIPFSYTDYILLISLFL